MNRKYENRSGKDRSRRPKRDRDRPRRGREEKSIEDIPSVRDTAAKVYAHWLRHPSHIDVAAQQILKQRSSGDKATQWSPRDKALFQELIYGVVRYHGRIEWLVNGLSSKAPPSDHLAYAAVAVGVYQLLYLDRVPAYAAVDAAVTIVRYAAGEMTSKWANAILRKISATPELFRTSVPRTKNPLQALSVLHSYPLWLIEHWRRTMNMEMLERFLIWNNRRPQIFLRTNTTRIDPKKLASLLTNNFDHPSKIDPNFLLLKHSRSSGDSGGDVAHWKVVKNGLASVQDVSQGLASRLLAPKDVEEILDLCSAPGGKTGHLAELSPNCRIIATDRSDERLRLVEQNVARCGYPNVTTIPYDDLLASSERSFDAVLVDAPCTGTGVLARRPDIRWRLHQTDLKRMAAVQLQLLRYAADRVRRGGRIIYSTCSIEPEENGEVVERFLSEHSGFRLVSACTGQSADREFPVELMDDQGCLNILGTEIGGDGIFAARLERNR